MVPSDFHLEAILADGDERAMDELRAALDPYPEIRVIGSAKDGPEAIRMASAFDPDLVFLAPDLPGLKGLAVCQRLAAADEGPLVVFVARSDRYALRAFDLGAADFLVKPLDAGRLAKCVGRLVGRARARGRGAAQGQAGREADRPDATSLVGGRLAIRDNGRVFLLDLDRVDWFEAAGNYIVIHVGEEQHVVREALSTLERALDPRQFLRIHRSTIVNIDRILDLVCDHTGGWTATLENGRRLRVSRTYRSNLLGY